MNAKEKKAIKADDERINRAFESACGGIVIKIMDIPDVFAYAREVIAQGADDAELQARLHWFVNNISVRLA